jgi:polysaccharide export outer membrane protein
MSRNAVAAFAVMMVAGFAGCAATARSAEPSPAEIAAFPAWEEADPQYRIYPGDQLEVTVTTAPELSRTLVVMPDGRIAMPLIAPLMAADRTSAEIRDALLAAYAPHLRDPILEVAPRGFASRQVFVGGEVERPGLVDIGAGVDAMQAVIQAGGFNASARRDSVLILRRAPGGPASVYQANLSPRAFKSGLNDLGPLARFDVIYVPRKPISQVGLFMQQYVREALPVQFSLFYNLAPENRN